MPKPQRDPHSGALIFPKDPFSDLPDYSDVLQNAIDAIRLSLISSDFRTSNVLELPAGRYKILKQVKLSPFVKLKAKGTVIFETQVDGDAAFHLAPEADDPTFLTLMGKQQWFRGPWINGVDGGFVFTNKLGARGTAIALEIGARSDLGGLRPTSRYAMTDIAIEGYDTAIKMNGFRNYIGSFERLHLELNNVLIQFGNPGQIVTDSGENFHFSDSVFAVADTGFRWHVDGMDCNFTNCSFDFIDTLFHVSRQFKHINVTGGHIESIETVFLEDSVHADDIATYMTLSLRSLSVYIKQQLQFIGRETVFLALDGIDWREMGIATAAATAFLVDPRINVTRFMLTPQQRRSVLVSESVNEMPDPYLEREPLNADMDTTPGISWDTYSEFIDVQKVIDTEGLNGGKAFEFHGTSSSAYIGLMMQGRLPIKPGQTLHANLALKGADLASANLEVYVNFYAKDGTTLIRQDYQVVRFMGEPAFLNGAWCYPDYMPYFVAPPGSTSYYLEYIVSNAALTSTVYVSGFYSAVSR